MLRWLDCTAILASEEGEGMGYLSTGAYMCSAMTGDCDRGVAHFASALQYKRFQRTRSTLVASSFLEMCYSTRG